jgi:hypothetical protein
MSTFQANGMRTRTTPIVQSTTRHILLPINCKGSAHKICHRSKLNDFENVTELQMVEFIETYQVARNQHLAIEHIQLCGTSPPPLNLLPELATILEPHPTGLHIYQRTQ